MKIGGVTVRLGGMAKGSGMIHPNMATMLGVSAITFWFWLIFHKFFRTYWMWEGFMAHPTLGFHWDLMPFLAPMMTVVAPILIIGMTFWTGIIALFMCSLSSTEEDCELIFAGGDLWCKCDCGCVATSCASGCQTQLQPNHSISKNPAFLTI